MATIKSQDLDLATLERLKKRVERDERSGESAGSLHVPSEPTDFTEPSNIPPSSDARENSADEFVIQLDAKSLGVFLNAMEAWILADRPPLAGPEDHPRERARRIREGLAGRAHSDSGAIQHEDRQR